ncbi:MAG: citrate lyase subunit alpha [Thermoplasmata archaeon]
MGDDTSGGDNVLPKGFVLNSIGRAVPADKKPYSGAYTGLPPNDRAPVKARVTHAKKESKQKISESKVVPSIKEALIRCGISDGMTLSFHHHLRDGDAVLNMVVDTLVEMGVKDIRLAPTALFGVHSKSVLNAIEKGVITSIEGSVNGPIGDAVTRGVFKKPVILRSHGGRARAVIYGHLHIDIAFIAAPTADKFGNLNGVMGRSACGSLGYAFTDAMYADKVVAVTDNLVDFPACPISIPACYVDYVVQVPSIGDTKKIVSGTLQITRDPIRLQIARYAVELIDAAGLLKQGISFQTGAGGIPLAVTQFMKERMKERRIRGSFGLGGVTGDLVALLEEDMLDAILDVQSFDLMAVESLRKNKRHIEISADFYASPFNSGAAVNMLDTVILGATEIDLNFNVNVNTESDGRLLHGIGGHSDTAAGAFLTIIAMPLLRGRLSSVVEKVITVTTPGETVDAVVTERGIALNPRRQDILEKVVGKGLPLLTIQELYEKAVHLTGKARPLMFTTQPIAYIEYRDATALDTVWMPANTKQQK